MGIKNSLQLSARNGKLLCWNLNQIAVKQASHFLISKPFYAYLCCKAPLKGWHCDFLQAKRMYSGQNINETDAREQSIKLKCIEMRGREAIAFIHLRHPISVTENNSPFGLLYWPWKTTDSSFSRSYLFCWFYKETGLMMMRADYEYCC